MHCCSSGNVASPWRLLSLVSKSFVDSIQVMPKNDLFEKYNRWYLQENFDNLQIELDAEYIWYFIEKPRIKKILIENEELLI